MGDLGHLLKFSLSSFVVQAQPHRNPTVLWYFVQVHMYTGIRTCMYVCIHRYTCMHVLICMSCMYVKLHVWVVCHVYVLHVTLWLIGCEASGYMYMCTCMYILHVTCMYVCMYDVPVCPSCEHFSNCQISMAIFNRLLVHVPSPPLLSRYASWLSRFFWAYVCTVRVIWTSTRVPGNRQIVRGGYTCT